jgi:AbrB family looped-hinge helix DNA binding protein
MGVFDNPGPNPYDLPMRTTVSKKGQVTIPKPLRLRFGIRPGQVLDVREERGCVVLSKQTPRPDAFDKLFGILKLGRSTDDIIREL